MKRRYINKIAWQPLQKEVDPPSYLLFITNRNLFRSRDKEIEEQLFVSTV